MPLGEEWLLFIHPACEGFRYEDGAFERVRPSVVAPYRVAAKVEPRRADFDLYPNVLLGEGGSFVRRDAE